MSNEFSDPPQPEHRDDHNGDLSAFLRSEVPAPAAGYFEEIDASLAQISQEASSGVHFVDFSESPESTSPTTGPVRTGTAQDTPEWRPVPHHRTNGNNRRRWLNLSAAAAVLAVSGMVVTISLLFSGTLANNSVQVGDDGGAPERPAVPDDEIVEGAGAFADPSDDESRPVAMRDHWHSVYGVWSCNAPAIGADDPEAIGAWLAHFDSAVDDVGIHSHNDGLIHIHPFTDEAAGENAQLHHFLTAMGAELTDDSLTLPDGSVLATGDDCNGEPAVLHIRKWPFDFVYTSTGPETERQIYTEDLASLRFVNDREIWQIVHAPLDADLPLLPQARLSNLNSMAGVLAGPDDKALNVFPADENGVPTGPALTEIPDDLRAELEESHFGDPAAAPRELCELEIPADAQIITPDTTEVLDASADSFMWVMPGTNSTWNTSGTVLIESGGAHLADAGVVFAKRDGVIGVFGQSGDNGRGLFYMDGAELAVQQSLRGPALLCDEIVTSEPPPPMDLQRARPIDVTFVGDDDPLRPTIALTNEEALSSFVFSDDSAICIDRYQVAALGLHDSVPIEARIVFTDQAGTTLASELIFVNDVSDYAPQSLPAHNFSYSNSDTEPDRYGTTVDVLRTPEGCLPTAAGGTYSVTITLDPNDLIREIDETNNSFTRTYEVDGF